MAPIENRALYFTAPRRVAIQPAKLPDLGDDQVLVRTVASAISAGTEMLAYRGQIPTDMPLDSNIAALAGRFAFPFRYGYTVVGQIIATGRQVETLAVDDPVFAFQPHGSHFVAPAAEVTPLPPTLSPDEALFFPNLETAVNLVQDAGPLLGERVAVLGQGIVGLLTTALLARFPLDRLVAVDGYPNRRETALDLGAKQVLAPDDLIAHPELAGSFDTVIEVSGNPAALNLAIDLARFGGKIVVGSWYGQKQAPLELGGKFHRARLHLVSSQVSTVAANLSGRWPKTRRAKLAWQQLPGLNVSRFISHRFPFAAAAQAYQLLEQNPQETLQVVLDYEK